MATGLQCILVLLLTNGFVSISPPTCTTPLCREWNLATLIAVCIRPSTHSHTNIYELKIIWFFYQSTAFSSERIENCLFNCLAILFTQFNIANQITNENILLKYLIRNREHANSVDNRKTRALIDLKKCLNSKRCDRPVVQGPFNK